MKNQVVFGIVLFMLVIFACSSPEKKSTPQQVITNPVETMNNGKLIFEEKCLVCHGADGTAGISNAANLKENKLDTSSALRIITHGQNGMPAFIDKLGTGEIEQVTNYVFTLRQ